MTENHMHNMHMFTLQNECRTNGQQSMPHLMNLIPILSKALGSSLAMRIAHYISALPIQRMYVFGPKSVITLILRHSCRWRCRRHRHHHHSK